MGMAGNGKGGAGAVQGQAGAGAKPLSPAAMQAQQKAMSAQALQQRGGPQAGMYKQAQMAAAGGNPAALQGIEAIRQKQQQMQGQYDQYRQQMGQYGQQRNNIMQDRMGDAAFMSGTGDASRDGMNRADFMPGGALSGANQMAAENPDAIAAQQAAAVANPEAAAARAAAKPAAPLNNDAMQRMQSQMQSNNQRMPTAPAMPPGLQGMQGYGRGKGGPGGMMAGRGADYRAQQMAAQRGGLGMGNGMDARGFANGGIVGLATGGQLGAPVSRGGVTYVPGTPAPAAIAPRTAAIAAAPTVAAAAPKVAWAPTAGPANSGSIYSGIATVPITAPAAYKAPATTQAIWQPPAKPAEAAGPAGLKGADMGKAVLFGASKDMIAKMTPQQYTNYMMFRHQAAGSGGGGGSGSDRGNYSR